MEKEMTELEAEEAPYVLLLPALRDTVSTPFGQLTPLILL